MRALVETVPTRSQLFIQASTLPCMRIPTKPLNSAVQLAENGVYADDDDDTMTGNTGSPHESLSSITDS